MEPNFFNSPEFLTSIAEEVKKARLLSEKDVQDLEYGLARELRLMKMGQKPDLSPELLAQRLLVRVHDNVNQLSEEQRQQLEGLIFEEMLECDDENLIVRMRRCEYCTKLAAASYYDCLKELVASEDYQTFSKRWSEQRHRMNRLKPYLFTYRPLHLANYPQDSHQALAFWILNIYAKAPSSFDAAAVLQECFPFDRRTPLWLCEVLNFIPITELWVALVQAYEKDGERIDTSFLSNEASKKLLDQNKDAGFHDFFFSRYGKITRKFVSRYDSSI